MKPGLCLFTDSLEPSGVGEHMLTLAAELCQEYRLYLVAPPGESGSALLARAQKAGITTLPLQVTRDPRAMARLRSWLSAHDVTIFHAHAGIGWEGHAGIVAARVAGTPVVLRTEHLPFLITDEEQLAEHDQMLERIDALICVSAAARVSFQKAGVAPGLLRVVRNGITPRPAEADRTAVRARFGLAPDTPLLLSVGRLAEQKGHTDLIAAMALVREHQPEAHLLIAGEGPLKQQLFAQIHASRLSGRVHLLGRRADVPELMVAADLFTLPSLFEGLPLVALEAMAVGLPVVATNVCGSAEAVVDGVTGRLVAPQDPVALARALLECLTAPERARAWGEAGRRRISESFSAGRMARETNTIYQELLARCPHRKPSLLIGASSSRTALTAGRTPR